MPARRVPGSARHGFLALGCSLALWGCTVVPVDDPSQEEIVPRDAAVYDDSLSDVDPEELDLSDFWSAPPEGPGRPPVPIHSHTVAELAERISPAVVNLYTTAVQKKQARVGINPNDLLPIRLPVVSRVIDFVPWKLPIPFRGEAYSLGSGFLINDRGYIVTNAHVVHNAVEIRAVRLGGREEVTARIVGRDPLTDTALLKIPPPDDGAFLPLAGSEPVRVGELVVAVGNPLGLSNSVTMGVVSAVERTVPVLDPPVVDFVQTDTAINPGNSGGPLVNLHGEVVGINTAIADQAQSIGFAIPVEILKSVMPLLAVDRPQRGWFGAGVRPVMVEERRELPDGEPTGVVVVSVASEGPARDVGMREGDRIVRVDGHPIDRIVAFRRAIIAMRPGQTVSLEVLRGGERLELSAELTERPES